MPAQLTFEGGCLVGRFKLAVGAVTTVIVPSCQGRYLLLSIPFNRIRGDITGGFLLKRLTKAFWGMISTQVEKAVHPQLLRHGLPPDTVTVDRRRDREGDVGVVFISLDHINGWLARKHPRLQLRIHQLAFAYDRIQVTGDLARHT